MALTKSVDSRSTAAGSALVNVETGETIRTANGAINVGTISYNESAFVFYENKTLPDGRRMLLSSNNAAYLGDVDPSTVLQGCQLLMDGNKNIVTVVEGDDPELAEDINTMTIVKADVKGCREAIESNDVAGLRADIAVDGNDLSIYCPDSNVCHILDQLGSQSGQEESGRRLLGSANQEDVITLQFGSSMLQCSSQGQCGLSAVVTPDSDGFSQKRRRLLGCDSNYDCNKCTANYLIDCKNDCSINKFDTCMPRKCPDQPWKDLTYYSRTERDVVDSCASKCKLDYNPRTVQYLTDAQSRVHQECFNPCIEKGYKCYNDCVLEKRDCEGTCSRSMWGCSESCSCLNNNYGAAISCSSKCRQSSGCFPSDALVSVDGSNAVVRARDLQIGERVLGVDSSGRIASSAVYLFPHQETTGMFPFKKISLSLPNRTITATKDHYIFVSNPLSPGVWDQRRAIAAGNVKPGDELWVVEEHKDKNFKLARIIAVEDVWAEGLIAPFTESGTVIVDGVLASSYTDLFGSEPRMHMFCAWVRKLWRVWPNFFHFMHAKGWASATALSVANSFAFLLNMAST